MPKSIKIYIGLLFLIFLGIILVDANRPKPINWTPTFSLNDKTPFGLYVFNEEVETLFSNQKIRKFGVSPYEFLDDNYDYENDNYAISGTMLYIEDNFSIDDESLEELLFFVEKGNQAFLSSSQFPALLRDTLHFKIDYQYNYADSLKLKVKHKEKYPNYYYSKGYDNIYFSEIDSTNTIVLGTQKGITNENSTNYIRVPFGEGYFYLHLQPIVFTNYYLLKNNYTYAEDVLSYLPSKDNVFWKIKRYDNEQLSQSPMRYFLSQPALRWAWYLALITVVVFMFFNAKRRQRTIPIITPLRNTTIDFTKTIGNLYYQEKDYMNIIDKKIIYFLEKVRNDYYIDTFILDDTFINRLHQKSGKSKVEVTTLIKFIKKLRNQSTATEKDVIELNHLIEQFYRNQS